VCHDAAVVSVIPSRDSHLTSRLALKQALKQATVAQEGECRSLRHPPQPRSLHTTSHPLFSRNFNLDNQSASVSWPRYPISVWTSSFHCILSLPLRLFRKGSKRRSIIAISTTINIGRLNTSPNPSVCADTSHQSSCGRSTSSRETITSVRRYHSS
jgi:hypothetical protein